ncbi:MAG: hypothetical protein HWE24_20330 [Oceanospirillaceae bacterium]|nr:hypothetical protein [Oceanospirillaceae bacterium]
MLNREIRIKPFTLVLILLLSCLSLSACSSFSANDDTKKAKKIREQNEWIKYSYYSTRSGYLDNIGFSKKSTCAIALMKSIDFKNNNWEEAKKRLKITNERSKIFENVVNDGVTLLQESGMYPESKDEIRKFVYQNIQQNETFLRNFALMIKKLQPSSDDKNNFSILTSSDDFKKVYAGSNCSSLLNYEIE